MGSSIAARRGRLGVGLAAAVLALTGCGSNFGAQSQQQYQPAAGVSDRSGQVYAIDTLVVTNGNGKGTVVSALINQTRQDDSLRAVTAIDSNGSGLTVGQLPASGLPLPSRQAVQLANSGAVRVSGKALQAGSFVTLTFTFEQAAPLEVDVPVLLNSSTYANVPLGPR